MEILPGCSDLSPMPQHPTQIFALMLPVNLHGDMLFDTRLSPSLASTATHSACMAATIRTCGLS